VRAAHAVTGAGAADMLRQRRRGQTTAGKGNQKDAQNLGVREMPDRADRPPPAIDPDCVPETLCDGPVNVQWTGGRAVITFTHARAKPGPLFEKGENQIEAIVRARIATSVDTLLGIRDLLNRLFPADKPIDKTTTSGGGAATRLH
jgi:hypothetical protein